MPLLASYSLGSGYGMPPPMVDRYGLGLRIDHGPMVS